MWHLATSMMMMIKLIRQQVWWWWFKWGGTWILMTKWFKWCGTWRQVWFLWQWSLRWSWCSWWSTFGNMWWWLIKPNVNNNVTNVQQRVYEATGDSTSVTTTQRRVGCLASPGTPLTHISIPVLHRLVMILMLLMVLVHRHHHVPTGVPRDEELFKLLSQRRGDRAHALVLHHGPTRSLATLSYREVW